MSSKACSSGCGDTPALCAAEWPSAREVPAPAAACELGSTPLYVPATADTTPPAPCKHVIVPIGWCRPFNAVS